MRKPPNSKTAIGHGDADAALAMARALRADGFHATSVKVGDVHIELAVVIDHKAGAVNIPKATTKSVIEEWGGSEFAKRLGVPQQDLVDDEEQPAVRS